MTHADIREFVVWYCWALAIQAFVIIGVGIALKVLG